MCPVLAPFSPPLPGPVGAQFVMHSRGLCRFAHVELLGPEDVCISYDLGPGQRLLPAAALEVGAGRLVEQRVASAEGVADVRKWLVITGGRLLTPPPTVQLVTNLTNLTTSARVQQSQVGDLLSPPIVQLVTNLKTSARG
jgi:hypothetical protein